jgi:hypothetical protein
MCLHMEECKAKCANFVEKSTQKDTENNNNNTDNNDDDDRIQEKLFL